MLFTLLAGNMNTTNGKKSGSVGGEGSTSVHLGGQEYVLQYYKRLPSGRLQKVEASGSRADQSASK